MGVMALLHWLVSEAISMVDITTFDLNGNPISPEGLYGGLDVTTGNSYYGTLVPF